MHKWLQKLLNVQPGEGYLVTLVLAIMFMVALGNTVGSNSVDGLLFAQLGTDWLPLLYIFAGLSTATVLTGNIILLSRYPHVQLFRWLPVILASVLLFGRLALLTKSTLLLPILWLLKEVLYFVQMSFTWGIANLHTHPRQAKRIFPLFTAGNIVGTVLGGFLTGPLVQRFSVDNMLILWGALLLLSALVAQLILKDTPAPKAIQKPKEVNILDDLLLGFREVKKSTLLCWISFASIVLIICSNSLYLVFSSCAAVQYKDAGQLASFLSLIQALSTSVALLLSLFVTNRLFSRFGIMSMFLLYPALFACGFGFYALLPTFTVLTAFRLMQLTWSGGVTGAIWPTIFNVVPSEKREVVSTFNRGISAQVGAILAGLFLMAAKKYLLPEHVALVGLGAALLGLFIIWKAKSAYGNALADLLVHGNPEVFLGNLRHDKEIVEAIFAATKDKQAAIRRVALEMLGQLKIPEGVSYILEAVKDERPFVREAALKALTQLDKRPAKDELFSPVYDCLKDKEKDVRLEALKVLAAQSMKLREEDIKTLSNDKDTRIKLLTAALCGNLKELSSALQSEERNERRISLWVLGKVNIPELIDLIHSAARDKRPSIRAASAKTLGFYKDEQSSKVLLSLLGDNHIATAVAAAETIANHCENASELLSQQLKESKHCDSALHGLTLCHDYPLENELRHFLNNGKTRALRYYEYARDCHRDDRPHRLLTASLCCLSRRWVLRCLRALHLLTNERTISVALDNLLSRDLRQHGSALEALEESREKKYLKRLLPLLEKECLPSGKNEISLAQLLDDENDWIRACAAWVALSFDGQELADKLTEMEKKDSSPVVRRVILEEMEKKENMETLDTLSLMEQIAFLRRVPLFSSLPPADLRDIAAVMREELYEDGTNLARQGEGGEELYLIVTGTVSIHKTQDGKDEELATCQTGEVVGDMALLSGQTRMASLTTVGQVRALVLGRKAFVRMVRDKPDIGLAVIEVLCERLRGCQLGDSAEQPMDGDEMAQKRREMSWASFF